MYKRPHFVFLPAHFTDRETEAYEVACCDLSQVFGPGTELHWTFIQCHATSPAGPARSQRSDPAVPNPVLIANHYARLPSHRGPVVSTPTCGPLLRRSRLPSGLTPELPRSPVLLASHCLQPGCPTWASVWGQAGAGGEACLGWEAGGRGSKSVDSLHLLHRKGQHL